MGNRGPQPGTGGRPRKPLSDKIAEGHAKKYTQGSEPLPEPTATKWGNLSLQTRAQFSSMKLVT